MQTQLSRVDGILNINKAYGMTSMDVVRGIKRSSGLKRVGHGGTLDPIATGVVPVCVGQATRVMEYLLGGTKEYRAVVELGINTDTYDSVGQITSRQDPSNVKLEDVEKVLNLFTGVFNQIPPMYSALKKNGQRLYHLARAGIEVEREPRKVEVHNLTLLEWSTPTISLEVSCGGGFYMRSLANDIGAKLGCGAHLQSLVRLRSGPFRISESISLVDAEDKFRNGVWHEIMYAADIVLENLRAVILSRKLEDSIRHGQSVPAKLIQIVPNVAENCRAYDIDGRLIAILKFNEPTSLWRPIKVFSMKYPIS